jgi:hypothetical protein
MKNFKVRKTSFFKMPVLMKWFQKVLAMKKTFNQCYLGLKQPKNGEKCHFYGPFNSQYS